jgi:hypothetical protein
MNKMHDHIHPHTHVQERYMRWYGIVLDVAVRDSCIFRKDGSQMEGNLIQELISMTSPHRLV